MVEHSLVEHSSLLYLRDSYHRDVQIPTNNFLRDSKRTSREWTEFRRLNQRKEKRVIHRYHNIYWYQIKK